MRSRILLGLAIITLVLLLVPALLHEPHHYPDLEDFSHGHNLPFTGDLPELRERGTIRVLVNYNRTNFFLVGPTPRGFEYELLKQYEKSLNRGIGRRELHTELVFIPLPFHELIPALLAGKGDIIAAGLTITPGRAEQVVFTDPYLEEVHEIVVGRRDAPALERLSELAGRQVFVTRASSFADHLQQRSKELVSQGLPAIAVSEAIEGMQVEDLLEMVDRGIIELTVADHHVAKLWSLSLPQLQLYPEVVIHEGGRIAWAVRPDNPELLESLNAFVATNRRGSLIGNILFDRYFVANTQVADPLDEAYRKRLRELSELFQRYAGKYDFDWLLIAAIAYQESGFDHSRRSPAGAVGIMQLRPSTAADPVVGLPNVHDLESNIHAGIKYLAFLREHYFDQPEMDAETRRHFTLAAYNAGPAKVRQMRRRAEAMGLDPDQWLGHTERAALEIVGQETVRYVRNITKFFSLYRSAFDQRPELQEIVEPEMEQIAIAAKTEVEERTAVAEKAAAVTEEAEESAVKEEAAAVTEEVEESAVEEEAAEVTEETATAT